MKQRLDKLLVEKGTAKNREIAKAVIMEGRVRVNGTKVTKSGTLIDTEAYLEVEEKICPYVSRGGIKLEAALNFFSVDPNGMVVLDVGCSTGGFSDCLLKKNALKIYAVDVGYGQIAWELRNDPRLVLFEKTNIRYLDYNCINDKIDLAVVDVSFISLLKILPKVREFLGQNGIVIALVKPQFEVGKGMVGKGGIVRNQQIRINAVNNVVKGAADLGFLVEGLMQSPITGQKGNIEYFLFLRRD